MSTHIPVKLLPESERPYEKFLEFGESRLSDAELLAIIIKTGTKELNSLEIAHRILSGAQGNLLNLYEYSFEDLKKIPGIGTVKAIQLKAVSELSARIAKTSRSYSMKLHDIPSIAYFYMEQLRHRKEEHLICGYFDAKGNFLGDREISLGGPTFTYVSPKDIVRAALDYHASIIIMLHNHPSGDPTPSESDINATDRVRECMKMMELYLADHIIIGDNDYFSFLEQNI